jgi:hypothetical protein
VQSRNSRLRSPLRRGVRPYRDHRASMRVMFATYAVLILLGVTYFSLIGLLQR